MGVGKVREYKMNEKFWRPKDWEEVADKYYLGKELFSPRIAFEAGANAMFASSEIAVVDRDAELPENPVDRGLLGCVDYADDYTNGYEDAQQDMVAEDWVKEVKK